MRTFLILSLMFVGSAVFAAAGESGIDFDEPEQLPVVAEPEPAPAAEPAPEPVVAPAHAPAAGGEVYHYSYSPKDDKPVNYIKDENEMEAGDPGNFIFTLNGEYANYYTGNKNKGGASIELGPQFTFSKYFAAAVTVTVGVREGNERKNNLYPVGFKLAPRVRALPWLFLFLEGGVEITKIAKGEWEYPFWLYGGGLMFNIGAIDRRSEYNLYKATSVKRTVFIVAFDKIKAPLVKIDTPDVYILRLGFSLEY